MSNKSNSKLLRPITILLIICFCSSVWADVKYGGGTGEPNEPYQIWDANDMQAIGTDANEWGKHFILMADIDLGQFDGKEGREKFNVIGRYYYDDPNTKPFTGVFDGDGHAISNLTYESNDVDFIGLFRYIAGANSQIKNLGLIDPNVDAGTGWCVGSLVGWLSQGAITNCYAENGSISGRNEVGGLVGYFSARDGTITDCYVKGGSVTGESWIGGLVGTKIIG